MTHADAVLEESIDIAAEPARVWSLVTDLPRMARWSPQVVRTLVRGEGPVGLGTRAVNLNRRGVLFWPTRSKVVRFEPHRDFAFRIKDNFTIWSFTLEPTDGGTRVVQRRETPQGTSKISDGLVRRLLGGQQQFRGELREGMQRTLRGIKVDAEA
jgi:hypothetical protein